MEEAEGRSVWCVKRTAPRTCEIVESRIVQREPLLGKREREKEAE